GVPGSRPRPVHHRSPARPPSGATRSRRLGSEVPVLHVRRHATPAAILALATATALAACGGGGGATAGPATPVPSGVIAIEAREYQFTPSTVTIPAGAVTFSVHNGGSQEPEFESPKGGQGVDEVEAR